VVIGPEAANRGVRATWRALGWLGIGLLIWLYVTPRPPHLDVEHGDKLQHLAAYATLTFWFVQLPDSRAGRWRNALALAALGVAMEFVQLATGYRTFSLGDMAANTAGVALGLQFGPPRFACVPAIIAARLARGG
jgi:VanZ family protein